MNANSDQEELIQEVLAKHRILIGNEDPIMVLSTINQRLARQLDASVEASLRHLLQDLEHLYHRWDAESKQKAERILSAALSQATSHLTAESEQLADTARRSIEAACNNSVNRITRVARRLEWLILGGGLAMVAGFLAIAWISVGSR